MPLPFQFTPSNVPPLEAAGLRVVSPTDVDTMARTVYGEARGESVIVQAAVAWVIVARVLAGRLDPGKFGWWGSTPGEVCLKKWQFSAWNPATPEAPNPNLELMRAARMGEPVFNRALGVVGLVLGGAIPNPCAQLATHYHDPSIPTPEGWRLMQTIAGPAPMTWFREGSWN